ncbi:unnamed protein product [Rhizoctonia solani]|uniref:VWFA domain-containing protein n=1 Tax=Rhizoctonia solani TaxID=456999 RepID=A0A8H3AP77_9AGAM|nr:unnamed protein product [Rhizoctonia solani]
MAALNSSSSGPPNLFNNGQLRDTNIGSDVSTEWPKRITTSCEATRVPLPHSPVIETEHISNIPIEDIKLFEDEPAKVESETQPLPTHLGGDKDNNYNEVYNTMDDNLSNFPTLFRLLDLYQEEGSGGLVEKVLIDQRYLSRLLNTLLPGSYESVSKIDFKALDQCTIKPLGIYGSKPEIIRFLLQINCLDPNSASQLLSAVGSSDDLRPGIYLALSCNRNPQGAQPEDAYIFFWPEDSTWEDKAISSVCRNRVTFMRYLSKMTDQMIGLISPEQAGAIVWASGRRDANNQSIPSEMFDESRMFSFEVEKSTEQEEDAIARDGFKLVPDPQKMSKFKDALWSCLVPGEEKAGLLTAKFEPAHTTFESFYENIYSPALSFMVRGRSQPLTIGQLPVEQLRILGDHGLRQIYPQPFARYDQRMALEEKNRENEYVQSIQAMEEGIQKDKEQLKPLILSLIRNHFSDVYPSLGIAACTAESESQGYERLMAKYPGLAKVPAEIKANSNADVIDSPEFQDLKYAWHTIRDLLSQKPTPPREQQDNFIREILGDDSGGEWTVVVRGKGKKHVLKAIIQSAKDRVASLFGYENKLPAQLLSDPEFIQSLPELLSAFPVISVLTDRISTCLQAYLAKLGSKLVKKHLYKVIGEEENLLRDIIRNERQDRFRAESKKAGLTLLNDLGSLMHSDSSSTVFIESVTEDTSRHAPRRFSVRGKRIKEHRQRTLFTIYPLELTEHDTQQCQSNEQYIPDPKLSNKHFFVFSIYEEFAIKFVHLIQDKCLVIVAGPEKFDLYLDDNVRLQGAIDIGKPKRSLKYDRLADPSQCIFAFDEGTRLLAFFHDTNLKGPELALFGFDETFSNIQARGSPFSLKEWYDTEVQIVKICFVSGCEEICLIEPSGRARVLSLVTLNFRPASVQIPGQIVDAFSAPDGSCLLVSVTTKKSEPPLGDRLLVYHWDSFGSNQNGISPTVLPPSDAGRIVTSFEGRNRVHLMSFSTSTMTATSVALSIKQKATEFSFRSNQVDSTSSGTESINNCLIDCHKDVWTRFPVAPAVTRSILSSSGREPRKLIFASTSNLQPVENYFSRMITKLERSTCKPVNTELRSISVVATSDPPEIMVQNVQRSKYLLGGFVVEFICLIPLHLAITKDNRFIPLKDGVWDPGYERSLLGADVPAIINSLSIGWYESVFQSYMATMPVRVVSSMGEQSVGKSYCLNHFADTTFAGSAMRTTEGVWLSCTPTNDYLLVSLDFEGVHSIERSAQEDALLVLFNTAVSNLVLFRNNFALSRDIAGLFQATMVLDPESNPSLFNSTLAIIIKDVTDSDAKDIVKEFSLKFNKIVQKEQEQNFISRLHRGRVQIIPWPVINSSSFYTLFHHLRRYLDSQPITHSSGGVFLHSMKTLMAKIKANDWGSLDQNLATHRAQQLDRGLQHALSRGSSDEADTYTPLKDLDTDEIVPTDGPSVVFYVPDISGTIAQGDEDEIEKILDTLIGSCLASSNIGPRHVTGDRIYVEFVQEWLYALLDQRLEQVRSWIQANVRRFPASNQDIRNIHAKVEANALAMRAAIETQPAAVEEQFSGRHETFQYTRYTQVERRLTCVIKIPPGKLHHIGEHSHTTDEKPFHHCNERCPGCQYLCTLPLGHTQQLHETSHGSMTTTQWAIEGNNQEAIYELSGRRFGIGDEGAPMLCNLPSHCQGGPELEHIRKRMYPDPDRPKDWISHRLKWARSGFQDPYSREQQADFAKCDVLCSGPEHNATATTAANPSYCNLPIFHPPYIPQSAPANGYVSADGHYFDCANPARLHQAYHIVFVIDSSSSMGSGDRTPLPDTPVMLSALYSFWRSREAGHTITQPRQDAYSVVTFNTSPTTRFANDFTSTTDQLLSRLLETSARRGTNFNSALAHTQTIVRAHWQSNRAPVVVFLSDGECGLDRNNVYDLCRTCLRLGNPLALYSVLFGVERSSASLREMAQIAGEVYRSAPRNGLGDIQGDPCAYYNAIDSIQLAGTFLGISNSLHKPRASLIGQSSGRRAL